MKCRRIVKTYPILAMLVVMTIGLGLGRLAGHLQCLDTVPLLQDKCAQTCVKHINKEK